MVEALPPAMRTITMEERRAYIPSDVMGLPQYVAFRKMQNTKVPEENEKIRLYNENAAKYNHPLKPPLQTLTEETVLMISDKTFIIALDGYVRVTIPKGIFECPVDIADHWYMQAHGVKKYQLPPQQFIPLQQTMPTVKPSVAELETLLKAEDDTPMTINADGTITRSEASKIDPQPSGVNDVLAGLAGKKG